MAQWLSGGGGGVGSKGGRRLIMATHNSLSPRVRASAGGTLPPTPLAHLLVAEHALALGDVLRGGGGVRVGVRGCARVASERSVRWGLRARESPIAAAPKHSSAHARDARAHLDLRGLLGLLRTGAREHAAPGGGGRLAHQAHGGRGLEHVGHGVLGVGWCGGVVGCCGVGTCGV